MGMSLTKAIELNTDLSHPAGFTLSPDLKAAIELGIEALKRELARRSLEFSSLWGALPGETED